MFNLILYYIIIILHNVILFPRCIHTQFFLATYKGSLILGSITQRECLHYFPVQGANPPQQCSTADLHRDLLRCRHDLAISLGAFLWVLSHCNQMQRAQVGKPVGWRLGGEEIP